MTRYRATPSLALAGFDRPITWQDSEDTEESPPKKSAKDDTSSLLAETLAKIKSDAMRNVMKDTNVKDVSNDPRPAKKPSPGALDYDKWDRCGFLMHRTTACLMHRALMCANGRSGDSAVQGGWTRVCLIGDGMAGSTGTRMIGGRKRKRVLHVKGTVYRECIDDKCRIAS